MSDKDLKAQIACIVREMSIEPEEQCDKIADEIIGLLKLSPESPLVLDGTRFPIAEIQRICGVGLNTALKVRDLMYAKFESPQKVHSCKCRTGQEGGMTVKRIDDGLCECPRCGGIIVPKPDARFVEVGDLIKAAEDVLPLFLQRSLMTYEDGLKVERFKAAVNNAVEKSKGKIE